MTELKIITTAQPLGMGFLATAGGRIQELRIHQNSRFDVYSRLIDYNTRFSGGLAVFTMNIPLI